ncbi:MAG: hypothetical protein J6N19_05090, partial [Clostridium sp.]|nr:hypothetical protein [Clostridium sp.]
VSYNLLLKELKDSSKGDGGYVAKIVAASEELGKDELKEIEGKLKTLKEQVNNSKKHPYLPGVDFESFDKALEEIKNKIAVFRQSVEAFNAALSAKVSELFTF